MPVNDAPHRCTTEPEEYSMLAATPNRTSSLRLFQVVLRASEPQTGAQVSGPLRAHALKVVRDAVLIAANPALIDAATAKDAIELALRLRDLPALRGRLAAVPATAPMPPELAQELLSSLQPLAA